MGTETFVPKRNGRMLLLVAALVGALPSSACSDHPAPQPPPASTPPVATICEPLDTLAPGTVVRNGPPPSNSFQPPTMDLAAHPFTFRNGTTTNNGEARAETGGRAGGSGGEIRLNNIVLSVSRGSGQTLHLIRFSFGEYGGSLDVRVNNATITAENFIDLNNTTVGGVSVTVLSGGLGNDRGLVEFQGPLPDQSNAFGQLAVGGQELWIDDICVEQ
ncbi:MULTISPECIES: hypothetical protein [unclassified Nonomuraea]|uniref:hypothetical protein n=1 Tax=unclassified Nonomuraea TaxID=2593643 RepID=UPI0034040FF3